MPRSGPLGTFTLPGAQKTQQPNTPIPSAVNNQGWADVEQTFNTVQPIAYGGTNASTESQARDNLGLEIGVDIPSNAQLAATGLNSRRNRVVNGDKLVSQENAQTSGTTNGRYLSDQNAMYFVSSAGTFTGVNVLTLSPAGGYRDRITITVADASLAAGERLTYSQNLEGSNVRDLKWGTADAVPAVARIGFKGPAGTYAYRLGNSAANRSYVALFTIAGGEANTDVVREFAIPGDTTGTWLNADGVIGITRDIVLACGSTFQGVAGWQGGNILGTSGVSNGMGTGGAVFEFFDEGFKADPDATGVYGQYEVNDTDAVYRSERYALQIDTSLGETRGATTLYNGTFNMPVAMARQPVSITGTYTPSSGSAGTVAVLSTAPGYFLNSKSIQFYNSASNWAGANVAVRVSAFLSARLS